jgi:hypothetical protein
MGAEDIGGIVECVENRGERLGFRGYELGDTYETLMALKLLVEEGR